jgi:hypothetical protein
MRHTLLVVVLAVTPCSTVLAQDSPPVTVGDRVRVTAPTLDIDKYDGTLQAWSDDGVTVDTLQVALAQLTRLDVYRGQKGHALTGALVGAVVLGAIAVPVGVQFCKDTNQGDTCYGAEQYVLPVVAIGVLGGALIGALIGSLVKSDRWEEIPLDQLRVSIVPQQDGRFAFGLSVAF